MSRSLFQTSSLLKPPPTVPTPGIEPGVLATFRLFVTIEWILFTLTLIGNITRTRGEPNALLILHCLQSGVLTLYLSLNGVQWLMGRYYLPVALIAASVLPVVIQAVVGVTRLSEGPFGGSFLNGASGLWVWLLLPLLLVSVQYGYRALIWFTVGTSGLSIVLNMLLPSRQLLLNGTLTEVVIRMLLFTLAGVMIIRLSKAQRMLRQDLAEKNAQLVHYAAALEALTISRERNRLARELHDTLAHTLSTVNIQLKAVAIQLPPDASQARETLRQAEESTRSGLNEARRALYALRTSPVEELGLIRALESQAHLFSERTKILVSIDLKGAPALAVLRREVEQTIYRIGEEALNNIARHAGATSVVLRLCQDACGVTLSVIDNGCGFDSSQPTPDGHYGLVGMRERASLIDGQLTVRSQPGQGTTVRLSVPAQSVSYPDGDRP